MFGSVISALASWLCLGPSVGTERVLQARIPPWTEDAAKQKVDSPCNLRNKYELCPTHPYPRSFGLMVKETVLL